MASNIGEKTPLIKKKDYSNTTICLNSSKKPFGQDSSTPKSSSRCANFLHCLSSITLEPVILLHSISYGIEGVFKTNMILDKTCALQLHYDGEICGNLDSGNHKREQDAVQEITNDYALYCVWIELLPAAFVMVLLGAWGDVYGRKFPLLLPLLGSALKGLGLTLNAYWWTLPPFYILLSYVPYGLTGNMMAIFMAAASYIGDEFGPRSRTTRLSIFSVMVYISIPLGHAAGMYLFERGGYVLVFGAEFLFTLLALLYTLVRMENKPPKRRATEGGEKPKLSLRRIKESLLVVFKKRENGGRAQILGHICCISLYVITYSCMSFLYVYTRKKFEWNYYDYTMWSIFSTPPSILGSCLLLPLLSYYWRVEDGILGFLGSSSQIFYGVLLGTAPVSWVLYLAQLAHGCSSMIISSSRSALSKLVEPDELGAVFAVVGMGECLLPLFSTPLYTAIYNSTLDVFPGTIFIVNSGITLIICCIYTWLLTACDSPKDKKAETK